MLFIYTLAHWRAFTNKTHLTDIFSAHFFDLVTLCKVIHCLSAWRTWVKSPSLPSAFYMTTFMSDISKCPQQKLYMWLFQTLGHKICETKILIWKILPEDLIFRNNVIIYIYTRTHARARAHTHVVTGTEYFVSLQTSFFSPRSIMLGITEYLTL